MNSIGSGSERSLDECAEVARARQHPSDVVAGPTCHHPPPLVYSHLHHHLNFNLLLTAIFPPLHRRTDLRRLPLLQPHPRRREPILPTLRIVCSHTASVFHQPALLQPRSNKSDRAPDHIPISHSPHILHAHSHRTRLDPIADISTPTHSHDTSARLHSALLSRRSSYRPSPPVRIACLGL